MMKIKRFLGWTLVALFALPAFAQKSAAPTGPDPSTLTQAQIDSGESPQMLYRLAAFYKQKGDLERMAWALHRLTALLPNNGELKLALASVYAQQGEKTKTYDALLSMQKQGFGYDLTNNASAFAKVSDTKVWKYIVDSLALNLKPFGEGKVAFTLPKGDYLFESLAFDPKRKQFLAGSVREGKIYLVGKDGKLQDFISPDASNGLWSVYGMAADPDNDALYVASTSSVYFKNFKKEDFGKAGVFKFKLSTGKLVEKYLLAPDSQPRTLSSVAVSKGHVFVADGLRNLIYRVDGGALKPMLENPKLTSIRGLAASDDGKRLYFADYELGVFGIDLAAGKAFDLQYAGDKLVLGGVDGLYWYDGTLVAIENGMSPKRVMRLKLDADGRKIVQTTPLDAANTAFALPTYGAIDGDGLYFVANSQKNDYDSYGAPKDATKLAAVNVFRSNLRFAWDDQGIGTPRLGTPPASMVPMSPSAPANAPGGLFNNVEAGVESGSGG